MPLFKIIIQTVSATNNKHENIFRWSVNSPIDDLTYDQLSAKIQNILFKLNNPNDNNHDYYNNNNNGVKENFQIIWDDGEDMCRIICTEDLHEAVQTLSSSSSSAAAALTATGAGGLDGNQQSIRLYVKTTPECESIKLHSSTDDDHHHHHHSILNESKTDYLRLPDLPETLEKLDSDDSPKSTNDNDTEKIQRKQQQHQSSDKVPLYKSLSIDQQCTFDLTNDLNFISTSSTSSSGSRSRIAPSAPLLYPTSMDELLTTLQVPTSYNAKWKGVNFPTQSLHAYAAAYTTYPYGYVQNKGNFSKLPSAPPASAAGAFGQPIAFYEQKFVPTSYRQALNRNTRLTASCHNLPRATTYLNDNNSNNQRQVVNVSAVIILLRHMGFKQSDFHLANIIHRYNGNLNSILDRLSIETNKKT
ncbi:unnamed protein product [Schistosoma turkestanicum]|nr:unnamed protein product [Schistosoma turkestanicum]